MRIAIVGGGPAGLMAAETACEAGAHVDVYDANASVGRKFLLAGRGGLNLTHSETLSTVLSRYGSARAAIAPLIEAFGPYDIRNWALGLGIPTFVGSSARVFPSDMKAAPLLRAWLRRLRANGVRVHVRHRWTGWTEAGDLRFETAGGTVTVHADATILALGGASWPKYGSDAAWVPVLKGRGISIAPLRPANCGFDVAWSDHVREQFAGCPVKSVAVIAKNSQGGDMKQQGEFVITETGVEGGAIYSLSASIREEIAQTGGATIWLDLTPEWDESRLIRELSRFRGKRTIASHLQRRVHIDGVKSALLREVLTKEHFTDPVRLAAAIKRLPLRLVAPRPIEEAISTAGGVRFDDLDPHLMLRNLPGVFCAGEMLDWEAPTGGYLLTACFATGRVAGAGAASWIAVRRRR